jgi:BirA family biotin operon repressor/biotin-[acetyl-CoA-carboxylase] ligase
LNLKIDKLHTIDSTNDYLKSLIKEKEIKEDMVVWAMEQTKGRGQMGTTWSSEGGKNLTFSVFRKVQRLSIHEQFYALMAASLAVKDVLEKLLIKNVRVKWPNDILSDKKKICGILIESVIKKGKLYAMIIGVGLNVNQTQWNEIEGVTSIKNETGIHFELEEILKMLLEQFTYYVDLLLKKEFDVIKQDYEKFLFRKGKPSTFAMKDGTKHTGIIQGVTALGKLILLEEDQVINEYDLKELQLLF